MGRLIALDMPVGAGFVAAVGEAWEAGDAVFPLDPRLPPVERKRVLDTVAPTHVRTPVGIEERGAGVDAAPGDALVIATSGTTHAPKAAVLTMDGLVAATTMTAQALDIASRDRWLLCLPPAHIGGFGVVARALLGGVSIDAHDGFDPPAVEAAARAGASLVSLVPAVLRRVDPTLFRLILLGGSAIPSDRPRNSVATYGMTETAGGIVYDGRPLDGVDLRVDADGQVFVRSPSLLRAYRSGPAPIDDDGFFATGDLGSIEDGVLSIDGRMDDVIITGGQKVWPQRVEAVLSRHPAVIDVRVVGRPDDTWGEIVVAEIVAKSAASLESLRDVVLEELPSYMAPRRIEVVPVVERTSLGKIRRARSETS